MAKSWSDDAPAPTVLQEHAHLRDPLRYRIKKAFLGHPLNRHTLSHQRLSKTYALGILSSDCISSSAYGSEQILLALLPAFGLAAYGILMPMTVVVLAVLIIVTFSYREVVQVYTKSGGAYVVSRDNFGPVIAQLAAVALMLDYIVTVAVQSSAGIDAIISTFGSLHPYKVEMTLAVVALLLYGNLRGVKEAGAAFAFPTYLFAGAVFVVFGMGVYRLINGTLPQYDPTKLNGVVEIGTAQGLLSVTAIFVLLRAFANGGSSLTGLEAISDGVSLFRTPEGVNARKTLVAMSAILGALVFGVSFFAYKTQSTPYASGNPTVISQIAKATLGSGAFGSFFFYVVQGTTMLILIAGANTAFNGFPYLTNFVATDGYLPRQLSKRGHRLAFSNGIILLSAGAVFLIIFTRASVEHLVAFYALGVFTGFTLTGFGMARRAAKNKAKGWRYSYLVNTLSGVVSLLIVIVFAVVKFTEGAWMIVLLTPILVVTLLRLNARYVKEQNVLSRVGGQERASTITRHDVAVLVDNVDLATVGTVRYARSLKPRDIKAVHFVIDDRHADDIREQWKANPSLGDIPLEFVDCPDRRIPAAAVDYAIRNTQNEDVELTLLLPRRAYGPVAGRILHDQTADEIARPISQLRRVVATIVPFDIDRVLDHMRDTRTEVHYNEVQPPMEKREVTPTTRRVTDVITDDGATDQHYSGALIPINKVQWRKRAQVRGHVTAIRSSANATAPRVEIEIWDEDAGITLQFLGRREITGVEVGSQIQAEGMVGEQNGALTILNPHYEIISH